LETTSQPSLTGVEWVLAWDDAGIENHSDGTWTVMTNMGFQVHVIDAWLMTSAVSLVPCDFNEDTGILSWLGFILGQPAVAAHAPFSDETMLELSSKESLTPSSTIELPRLDFTENQYCSSYWLLARGGPGSQAEHTSLYVQGTWSKGARQGLIGVDSDFTRAHMEPLEPVALSLKTPRAVLKRRLSTAFDNIDFENDNDYTVAWRTIWNLTERVDFQLQ
jgi:hypothetical protein